MYARSTMFRTEPAAIDEGLGFVRDEVMPTVTGLDGCIGLSLLADRDTGRCIVTSAWRSREDMRSSEPRVAGLRDRGAVIFGTRPEVQEWEIAVMHRRTEAPDGACTRVSWLQAEPGRVDRVVDTMRMGVLPRLDDLRGFCSASLLVDRSSGRCAAAVTYDSRGSLEASRETASGLRSAVAEQSGSQILEVAEFDLVLAHLRVPETV